VTGTVQLWTTGTRSQTVLVTWRASVRHSGMVTLYDCWTVLETGRTTVKFWATVRVFITGT
jgi:hypothetical protein